MAHAHRLNSLKHLVQIDIDREAYTGIPEVIYGEFKSDDQIVEAICQSLGSEHSIGPISATELVKVNRRRSVIVSRLRFERIEKIEVLLGPTYKVQALSGGSLCRVSYVDSLKTADRGDTCHAPIAVLAAGTSDAAVAMEAQVIAEEMGVRVLSFCDVGVAGLHRLIEPLEQCQQAGVVAIIAVAGMEAALPTVVRSLVSVPVIGVPTSVGYGVSAGGHVALNAMLASCTPGLTVVNIDNGIGAGASAALIARGRM